jgi:Flp pilus assembly pilin Flp
MPPAIAKIMDHIRAGLTALRRDRSGATIIEYALIVVFISILVVSWAISVGSSVTGFFTAVNNGF